VSARPAPVKEAPIPRLAPKPAKQPAGRQG